MNRSFAEPLVVTETGGRRGGGAVVTPLGAEVLARYRNMETKASAAVSGDIRDFEVLLRPTRRKGS
jgi:molybdate transport system regulatory protein